MARTPPFRPRAHEVIELWGTKHTFCEHPAAPGMVFAQEGGRGVVYQLSANSGASLHGLKVFASAFRVSRHQRSSKQLDQIGSRVGLAAARRRVVDPDDLIARRLPSLQYAVLMPWIRGTTWYDCLQLAETSGTRVHTSELARRFALSFLDIMAGLEGAGIAHTDISPGNVILDDVRMQVELLDLEDIYAPGIAEPEEKTSGTPGYQHHKRWHTWRPEGDRYAVAVLTSELLLLSDDAVARRSSTSGFFVSDCTNAEAREAYDMAIAKLSKSYPRFAKLFHTAWFAEVLSACPEITELHAALHADVENGSNAQEYTTVRVPPRDAATPTPATDSAAQAETLPFKWMGEEEPVPWVPVERLLTASSQTDGDEGLWFRPRNMLLILLIVVLIVVGLAYLAVDPLRAGG
jgi:hypothetical protein